MKYTHTHTQRDTHTNHRINKLQRSYDARLINDPQKVNEIHVGFELRNK